MLSTIQEQLQALYDLMTGKAEVFLKLLKEIHDDPALATIIETGIFPRTKERIEIPVDYTLSGSVDVAKTSSFRGIARVLNEKIGASIESIESLKPKDRREAPDSSSTRQDDSMDTSDPYQPRH